MTEQLHDFFIMVGGAAAALTGLVFVALSLNLEAIVKDLTHRNRAIGTLGGFTAIFVICACGLIGGKNNQAFGIEWLTVSVIAAYVYVAGIVKAKRSGISVLGIGIYRIVTGTALYVIEILGVFVFILGNSMGLYVAALSMVALLAYTVTGAWLLVVGVYGERTGNQSKKLK